MPQGTTRFRELHLVDLNRDRSFAQPRLALPHERCDSAVADVAVVVAAAADGDVVAAGECCPSYPPLRRKRTTRMMEAIAYVVAAVAAAAAAVPDAAVGGDGSPWVDCVARETSRFELCRRKRPLNRVSWGRLCCVSPVLYYTRYSVPTVLQQYIETRVISSGYILQLQ